MTKEIIDEKELKKRIENGSVTKISVPINMLKREMENIKVEVWNEALQKVLEVVAEDKRIKEFYFLQKNIEALRK